MNLKYVYTIACCFVFMSCGFNFKKEDKQIMKSIQSTVDKETIDYYTDDYTITPKVSDPKFEALVAEFKTQKHRFEFNTCQFKYNGQSFFIGDTVTQIIQIFGQPDNKIESVDGETVGYRFLKYNLDIVFSVKTNRMVNMWVYLSNHKGHEKKPYNVLMFRKIPYHLDMTLNEFMTLSDLTHNKLRRSYHSFFMFQKECPPSKNTRILTTVGADATYKQKGGGHLTWAGDFDSTSTSVIKRLVFAKTTLEDFKQ